MEHRLDTAIRLLERSLQVRPGGPPTRFLPAAGQQQRGERLAAQTAIETALRLKSPGPPGFPRVTRDQLATDVTPVK